jgi:hypothetical protein
MREIQASPELVAHCGLYCGACGSYLKERCVGCHENEKASWCNIRICCIEKSIATCAECGEYANPKDCAKFNNFISEIFGLIFRSDRAACIGRIREIGMQPYAEEMAERKLQSIKK